MKYYIKWFSEKRTCVFKTWFYWQLVCCVYGILWWTALFTWRMYHLNKALQNSERNDTKNHGFLRILTGTERVLDVIERPLGSYEEVAQQNGAAAELILML